MPTGTYLKNVSNHLLRGLINYDSASADVYKMGLVLSSYTANYNTEEFVDDGASGGPGNNRAQTSAVDVGDLTITKSDPAEDSGNTNVDVDGTDASFTFGSIDTSQTIQSMVFFKYITSDLLSPLWANLFFTGGTLAANGSDVVVTPNAKGYVSYGY